MIIVLKPKITKRQENSVLREIRKLGYEPHVMRGVARVAIGAEKKNPSLVTLMSWPQVESVTPIQKKLKLVSREAQRKNSTVKVSRHAIGGKKFHVMAGPCSVESEQQLMETAHAVRKAGATILRGGVKRWRAANHARWFQETHARAEAIHQGGQSELGAKRKLTNPRGPSHWPLHHGAGKSFPQ